jgi:hypothetical protein
MYYLTINGEKIDETMYRLASDAIQKAVELFPNQFPNHPTLARTLRRGHEYYLPDNKVLFLAMTPL